MSSGNTPTLLDLLERQSRLDMKILKEFDDDVLRDPLFLNSLLDRTPISTRMVLLKANFELWRDSFPIEAAEVRKTKVLEIVK